MDITVNSRLGELVAANYQLAVVFKKYQIDYCCNGDRSVQTVANEQDCDVHQLIDELKEANKADDKNSVDFLSWPIDLLAVYIEKTHHQYVKNKIDEILPLLNKIVQVHGSGHPELYQINDLFNESAKELLQHMAKEEADIFPLIKNIIAMPNKKDTLHLYNKSTVEEAIVMMHQEHDTEGERFRQIAKLSHNYTLPKDGCATYSVTMALLKAFEENLHLHIHLENNILFPKAIQLEKEVRRTLLQINKE